MAGTKDADVRMPEHATARDVLQALTERYPALAPLVWEADGGLTEYIRVFVNGREIRHLHGLDTHVAAHADVDIFPPVAGG